MGEGVRNRAWSVDEPDALRERLGVVEWRGRVLERSAKLDRSDIDALRLEGGEDHRRDAARVRRRHRRTVILRLALQRVPRHRRDGAARCTQGGQVAVGRRPAARKVVGRARRVVGQGRVLVGHHLRRDGGADADGLGDASGRADGRERGAGVACRDEDGHAPLAHRRREGLGDAAGGGRVEGLAVREVDEVAAVALRRDERAHQPRPRLGRIEAAVTNLACEDLSARSDAVARRVVVACRHDPRHVRAVASGVGDERHGVAAVVHLHAVRGLAPVPKVAHLLRGGKRRHWRRRRQVGAVADDDAPDAVFFERHDVEHRPMIVVLLHHALQLLEQQLRVLLLLTLLVGRQRRVGLDGVERALRLRHRRVLRRAETRLALLLDAAARRRRQQREEQRAADVERVDAVGPRAEREAAAREPGDPAVGVALHHLARVDVAAAGAVEEVDVLVPPVARLLEPSGGEVAARVQHRDQHVATVVSLVLVEVSSDAGLNFGQSGWRGRHHLHAARTGGPGGRQQRRWECGEQQHVCTKASGGA